VTEQLGRRARWVAAVLVAPGAAALFGASVDWAATARPATSATPAQHVLAGATDPSPQAVAAAQRVYRTALERHRRAAALDKALAALNRKLARMIAADKAVARAGRDGSVAYPGRPGPLGAGPAPVPVIVLAPPPVLAPAPPVQVVTGASGVPK
jgi:hypothetical protein